MVDWEEIEKLDDAEVAEHVRHGLLTNYFTDLRSGDTDLSFPCWLAENYPDDLMGALQKMRG